MRCREREIERLGDSQPVRVDVRVIAATNSNLEQMVEDGAFRKDLYYRLNVIPIHLPPLSERRDDIPLLVKSFILKLSQRHEPARTDVVFSQEAMRRLMAHDWPGNIRQLENIVERALTMTPGRSQIEVGDLPADLQTNGGSSRKIDVDLPDDGMDLQEYVQEVERHLIRSSLERTGGNKRKAADLLNIKRTTTG